MRQSKRGNARDPIGALRFDLFERGVFPTQQSWGVGGGTDKTASAGKIEEETPVRFSRSQEMETFFSF